MGLLNGTASVTRFNVISKPADLDFDQAAFTEIPPGSELRESLGFVPMEPGEPYEIGAARYAFRIRVDRLRPDPVAVRERLRELIRVEIEAGAPSVGPKKRKQLRELAEEELVVGTMPSQQIIEGTIDGDVLYVGSTAKNFLGVGVQMLRKIGVLVEPKTPWIDRKEQDIDSEIVASREPGESVLGCRFLKALVGADRELLIEPESGLIRLQTEGTRISLAGEVMKDLLQYIKEGAEILSAKLLSGDAAFRFDALPFRVINLKIETARHEHWTETLDERLEKIADIYELLDRKYVELRPHMT